MMELDRDDCQSDESTVEDVDDATYSLGDLSCWDVQLWATGEILSFACFCLFLVDTNV